MKMILLEKIKQREKISMSELLQKNKTKNEEKNSQEKQINDYDNKQSFRKMNNSNIQSDKNNQLGLNTDYQTQYQPQPRQTYNLRQLNKSVNLNNKASPINSPHKTCTVIQSPFMKDKQYSPSYQPFQNQSNDSSEEDPQRQELIDLLTKSKNETGFDYHKFRVLYKTKNIKSEIDRELSENRQRKEKIRKEQERLERLQKKELMKNKRRQIQEKQNEENDEEEGSNTPAAENGSQSAKNKQEESLLNKNIPIQASITQQNIQSNVQQQEQPKYNLPNDILDKSKQQKVIKQGDIISELIQKSLLDCNAIEEKEKLKQKKNFIFEKSTTREYQQRIQNLGKCSPPLGKYNPRFELLMSSDITYKIRESKDLDYFSPKTSNEDNYRINCSKLTRQIKEIENQLHSQHLSPTKHQSSMFNQRNSGLQNPSDTSLLGGNQTVNINILPTSQVENDYKDSNENSRQQLKKEKTGVSSNLNATVRMNSNIAQNPFNQTTTFSNPKIQPKTPKPLIEIFEEMKEINQSSRIKK